MSEEIIKVLDNLAQKFGIAIDWTSQNIVPYLQNLGSRYIKYNNIIATIQIIISIILIIIGIMCIKELVKWSKREDFNKKYFDNNAFLFILGIIGSLFLIALGILFIIGNVAGIIQNIYMPELTILEYIQGLT